MTWVRRLALGLLGTAAALLLLAALGIVVLDTPWGQDRLAAGLGRVLSDPSSAVSIGGLRGAVPFDFRISRITVADAAGPRIVVADVAARVSAAALLRGRIVIPRLAIGSVDLLRPESSSTSSGGIEPLLSPPLPVALHSIDIAHIALGSDFLGMPLTLAADGSLSLGGGAAKTDLVLRQIGGDAAADLHLAYTAARLDIDASVRQPSGEILAALLNRGPLPLSLAVTGAGPLDDWQGTLKLAAGSEASAKARLTIAGDEPRRIALDGSADIAALLPERLRPLAQGTIAISAAATVGNETIALDTLAITGPERVSAQGSYARQSGALSGLGTVAVADLAPLAPIVGVPLQGSASAQVTVGGTLDRPSATLALDAANLRAPQVSVAEAHASFSASGATAGPVAISASGTLSGIAPLPPGLAPDLDWSLSGTLDPMRKTLALDRIAAHDGGVTLAGAASASREGAAGTLSLALSGLQAFDRGALGGTLDLAADFRAAADGSGTVVLSGTLAPTGGGRIAALLGPTVEITGIVERAAAGAVAARDVRVDAAGAALSASASRAADGTIAADFSASVPRLSLLDPDLAGSATARGRIGGPADAPRASLTLEAPAARAYGRRIEGLRASIDLPSLALARGHVAAEARIDGLAVDAAADAAYADGKLALSRIAANAGGAHVEGTATLADIAVEGTLAGRVPSLAPLSALAGTALRGSARFEARAQGNRYALTVDGTDLMAAGASVQRLRLAASVSDLAHPSGTATIEIANARAGAATLDSATLAARSDRPGHFTLTASAKGDVAQPVMLSLGAGVGIETGAVTVQLAHLDGAVGGLPLKLGAPLRAEWSNGTGRFSGLALGIGDGRLSGDGTFRAEGAIALHLLARGLPVHALAGLANKEAEGSLGFELTLAGTRRAPQATLVVDGEGLRFNPSPEANLPALGLVLRADWRDGRVSLAGRLAGPRGGALGWRGSAPLVAPASGFVPSRPRNGSVEFRLEGDGELGPIAGLFPLGEDRLAGRFSVDVNVGGTVGEPDASGRLEVSDARYENFATGAVLTGVHFALVGNRDRLLLQNFAAGDGGNGVLSLQGAVDLAASPVPEFELTGEAKHFRALRRDEGSATASGTFKLAGSITAPRLEAALTIDEANLAVPEKPAAALTPVKAVEIDSATGQTLTPQSAASGPSPLETLALDVTVTLPGRAFVRGRGLDSEWRGQITVKGTTHQPVITGHLDVVHGTFDFIGVTFNLTTGAVNFLGGTSIDPTIAIEATAQSSDITAIVDISGTATEPTIKLSSQPALPRDEVLSRLLFGTSMSQIGPAQGLQLASAAASLAGGQSLDVLGKIRSGLGLDRLSLGSAPSSVVPGVGVPAITGTPGEPGSGPATGIGTTPLAPGSAGTGGAAPGTALNAGKYVANGVYVGVSQGLGTGTSTVTVQVDVTRHVSVETQAGGETNGTGIGVSWKLDY